jgi:hypothetical protein
MMKRRRSDYNPEQFFFVLGLSLMNEDLQDVFL